MLITSLIVILSILFDFSNFAHLVMIAYLSDRNSIGKIGMDFFQKKKLVRVHMSSFPSNTNLTLNVGRVL